jgi:hypothetical protein
MTEKDASLDILKRHVATGEPLEADVGDLVAADAPDLVAALFALCRDEKVCGLWSSQVGFEQADAMGKVAWASSRDEAVEARIDELLESGEAATIVETLARAGVAWDSPALGELLDHDASRRAAALLLAVARPGDVQQWLDGCDVLEDALDVLRAAALDLSDDLYDTLVDWADVLDDHDDADFERARLDGFLAVLDPHDYARRMLAGDSDIDWLGDLPVVADFLQVHGPTHWLSVLGLLEAVKDPALELASLLAVSAAEGMGFEEPSDDQARQLIGLLSVEPPSESQGAKPENWEPIAAELGLGFAIAVVPDEDLSLLAAQVAAHERLIAFGIHSPGIPGLPLSATSEESIDLDASSALLNTIIEMDDLTEATTLAVVRTLDDLRALVAYDQRYTDHAEAWAEQFLDSDSRAIRLAVRQLLVTLDPEAARREASRLGDEDAIAAAIALSGSSSSGNSSSGSSVDEAAVVVALEKHARLEGPLGLDCARRLADIGTDAALGALAGLWKTGSVYRVAFYRDCLLGAVVDGV